MTAMFLAAAPLAAEEGKAEGVDSRTPAAIQLGINSVARAVKTQHQDKKRIAPDRETLEGLLRLEMRQNVASLRTISGFYRKYPEEKSFARYAWAAEKKIQEHVGAVRSDAELADPVLTKKIALVLTETAQQMAGFMAVTLSRKPPELPPMDASEKELLDRVPKPPDI